ncbi:MAG: hypothetical protein WCP32_10005 [Bacteroidota bacterium]
MAKWQKLSLSAPQKPDIVSEMVKLLNNKNCLSALVKLQISMDIAGIMKNNFTPSGFKTGLSILSIIISPLRGLQKLRLDKMLIGRQIPKG